MNEIDPKGTSAAAMALRGGFASPIIWQLPKVAIPEVSGTVLVGALRASVLLWGLESVGEMGVYAATGGHLEGPTMQLGKTLIASHIPAVQSGIAADPRIIMMWQEAAGHWTAKGDFQATSYENAMKGALVWLGSHGFKADATNLTKGLADTTAGLPFGKTTANGKVGFRVEWDDKIGAHINVFDKTLPKGMQNGPHFTFPGGEAEVEKLQKIFGR